jgi:site-specific DNA-methyltransferase (adenine-specific)
MRFTRVSIITDPPYGLEFMGKNWDYGIPGIAYWREALRIAKPGATLLAFGGSRTYHRLTCAIEDAGWEIRDCIMWVYGSGFPKSHDVSKGIDKAAGAEREVSDLHHNPGGNGGYQKQSLHYQKNGKAIDGRNSEKIKARLEKDVFITAPATPLAAKFDGYGTALKPAHEPIVVAMKPIDQSFAANAEKWGVAGLWIDGGRVETDGESLGRVSPGIKSLHRNNYKQGARPKFYYEDKEPELIDNSNEKGRWPANVIHDGSEEVLAEFDKAGVSPSSARPNSAGKVFDNDGDIYGKYNPTSHNSLHNDSGSAARYFAQCPPDPTAHPEAARFHYCPKAGKRALPGQADTPTRWRHSPGPLRRQRHNGTRLYSRRPRLYHNRERAGICGAMQAAHSGIYR